MTSFTAPLTQHCNSGLVILLPTTRVRGLIVDRVRRLGKSRSFTSSSLARYWTSVQSIDGTRWRNVRTLAGVPHSLTSARESVARGALPPSPQPRLALFPCNTPTEASARHWTSVQSILGAPSL